MNHFSDLPHDQLQILIEQFRAGQYYLLLGSGVSLDSNGDDRAMRSASTLRDDLSKLNSLPSAATLQQAYSLLTPAQVESEITKHYDCSVAGPTIDAILAQKWRRIYTFNVDNCLERVILRQCTERKRDYHSALEVKNYSDDYSDIPPAAAFSIIHLHGFVDHAATGYVFSHQEYAKVMARPNSWMLTLTQLLRSEPFIVAGTSLEEIDVAFYLEQRSSSQIRSDDGPSILVEPYPNKLTERLCETHGLWLFRGTALDFSDEMAKLCGPTLSPWDTPTPQDNHLVPLSRSEQLRFSSTFERVPRNIKPERDAGKFLLGAYLTWEMLAAKVDVPRQATSSIRNRIVKRIRDEDTRFFFIVDEPGAGKSSLLKRIAFDLSKVYNTVYFFAGQPFIEEDDAATIFDLIVEDVLVFIDNWADHQAYFKRVTDRLSKRNIVFVGAERSYRLPYIEQGLSDENYEVASESLAVSKSEAKKLLSRHQDEGLSSADGRKQGDINQGFLEIVGEPISVAVCRIQNNFRSFDRIVSELLGATTIEFQRIYTTAAIARYCYSSGVRRRVLVAATSGAIDASQFELEGALPLVRSGKNSSFLAPKRSVVADRVISLLVKSNRELVVDAFVSLANALAPYVNRTQISARSPEALQAGRLMDFDQVVKRIINADAEYFYDAIRDNWSWNSRYWEQVSLLKLDRYLVDQSDHALLQASIQHARHAYAIERHPLSLTTLAKVLFIAMDSEVGDFEYLFREAFSLMRESIDIESRWDTMRGTAFVVCFNGVLSYVNLGGLLDGDQAEQLRDMIATTHRRKMNDRKLNEVREAVSAIVNAGDAERIAEIKRRRPL